MPIQKRNQVECSTVVGQSSCISLIVLFIATCSVVHAVAQGAVDVRWLGNPPSISQGLSWGVPWPKGTIPRDHPFTLTATDGSIQPLQTWPLAYWPDGSLKWSGFATVAGPDISDGLVLQPGRASDTSTGSPELRVRESDTTVEVDTGPLRARIGKWGSGIIESLLIDGREVARDARLICVTQDGSDGDAWDSPPRTRYEDKVETLTVEQSGPVRAVIRLEGVHRSRQDGREWLPFVIRLYFYAGETSVRVVHTIIYDGDEDRDFIRGLGLAVSVPMREQIQNRHIRFSGESNGLWAEPIQPMIGRGGRFASDPDTRQNLYPLQLEGQRVPNVEDLNARGRSLLSDWAVWSDFKLVQPNADGFTVVKRTNPQSVWLAAGAGRRASGLVFAGDVSGGLALGLKDFWESYPSSLEVRNAGGEAARVYAWMWSPDAPVMDMRHYDTHAHGLEAVYEDVQPGLSTPHGVARTSEITLFPVAGVPNREETAQMARAVQAPSRLVCTPAHYHAAKAFGIWSLPDPSTPFKKALEERLDSTLDYYLKAVDQHRWYGFWDYGDVMHSYDPDRHVWRYDLGGMAWDNSELGTDMWLWYSFLRSGRADVFRMAEAMTRHTGEVDCYHIGPLAMLGSRHNVRHWGCGAKEVRISQAAYRRFHYYLTTDERTGDLMREVVHAEQALAKLDPMRLAQPATEREKQYPGRLRVGPDWLALVGNWMTEWERTGDPQWRDKILTGVASLDAMPFGLRSGLNLVMGFDPDTGQLFQVSDEVGDYNLATIMGGAEVVFELNEMLDNEQWQRLWMQYCRLYRAPADVLLRDRETGDEGADGRYGRGDRLDAYVYFKTGNEAFTERAIAGLFGRRGGGGIITDAIDGPEALNPVDEARRISTNRAAQNSLVIIQVLEMCADRLPTEVPEPASFPRPRQNRGGQ